MITKIDVTKEFTAVPYLKGSALIKSHPGGVFFSSDKPNVIVGENGAGKSALLKALALHTLSYYTGNSSLDDNYVSGLDADKYWHLEKSWLKDCTYLNGLNSDSDFPPTLYYRPGFIPGDETSLTHALMCGYEKEARAHGVMVDKKSSGQQSQALLESIKIALSGKVDIQYGQANWSRYHKRIDLSQGRHHFSIYEIKAEILADCYSKTGQIPLILLDEPEQSLDAKAEAMLWDIIAKVDSSKVQVISATHSWYPLIHPEYFNLIEASPGYINEVRCMIGADAESNQNQDIQVNDLVRLASKPDGYESKHYPLTVGNTYEVLGFMGSNIITTTDIDGESADYWRGRVSKSMDHVNTP